MGLFSDLFGSAEESSTQSTLDPREVESPFGSVSGTTGGPLNIEPSEGLLNLQNLFQAVAQSQLENFQNFDQAGFTETALEKLRALARPEETRGAGSVITNLFNRGILGRNVNDGTSSIQPELLQTQRALNDADLQRQLQAIGLGNDQAKLTMGLGLSGLEGFNAAGALPLQLAGLSTSSGNQSSSSRSVSTPSPISAISGLVSGMGGFGGMSSGLSGLFSGGSAAGSSGLMGPTIANRFASPSNTGLFR